MLRAACRCCRVAGPANAGLGAELAVPGRSGRRGRAKRAPARGGRNIGRLRQHCRRRRESFRHASGCCRGGSYRRRRFHCRHRQRRGRRFRHRRCRCRGARVCGRWNGSAAAMGSGSICPRVPCRLGRGAERCGGPIAFGPARAHATLQFVLARLRALGVRLAVEVWGLGATENRNAKRGLASTVAPMQLPPSAPSSKGCTSVPSAVWLEAVDVRRTSVVSCPAGRVAKTFPGEGDAKSAGMASNCREKLFFPHVGHNDSACPPPCRVGEGQAGGKLSVTSAGAEGTIFESWSRSLTRSAARPSMRRFSISTMRH